MKPDDLAQRWGSLPTPGSMGLFEASMVTSGAELWAAVDHNRIPTLLIPVPRETQPPVIETKGLSVSVGRHRVAGREDSEYLVLQCHDDVFLAPFAAVGSEISDELADSVPDDRSRIVAAIVNRWKWFWNVERDRLSEREALGLFAELWFLDQWVGVEASSIEAWTGSEASRHDFQWASISVEVKATAQRTDKGLVHRIQSLDQLADPESGILYLFSMQVVQDRLAQNSLPVLVDRCASQLRGLGDVRDQFLRKVSRRGYSPAHRGFHELPYRIIHEDLYEVDQKFPRLTRASFPNGLAAGITDVSYSLDMAACHEWHRASGPGQWVKPDCE